MHLKVQEWRQIQTNPFEQTLWDRPRLETVEIFEMLADPNPVHFHLALQPMDQFLYVH